LDLAQHPGNARERLRRYQGLNKEQLAFRPTGPKPEYFGLICARISSAGWRPGGAFPREASARGIDLSNTDLSALDLNDADIEGSSFRYASIDNCIADYANLDSCDFTGSSIYRSSLMFTGLQSADFHGAEILDCCFSGATLEGASFADAQLTNGAAFPGEQTENPPDTFYGSPGGPRTVPVPPNDFTNAVGIDRSNPIFSGRRDQRAEGATHQLHQPPTT